MERTQCAGNRYLFLRLLILDSSFEHGCAASLVEDSGRGTQMAGAYGAEEVNFSFNSAKRRIRRRVESIAIAIAVSARVKITPPWTIC